MPWFLVVSLVSDFPLLYTTVLDPGEKKKGVGGGGGGYLLWLGGRTHSSGSQN